VRAVLGHDGACRLEQSPIVALDLRSPSSLPAVLHGPSIAE
jgi:hypothetical protein